MPSHTGIPDSCLVASLTCARLTVPASARNQRASQQARQQMRKNGLLPCTRVGASFEVRYARGGSELCSPGPSFKVRQASFFEA